MASIFKVLAVLNDRAVDQTKVWSYSQKTALLKEVQRAVEEYEEFKQSKSETFDESLEELKKLKF